MTKPNWNRTLSEVLKHPTKEIKLISEKTGNEYECEVISILDVASTGNVEQTNDGKYKYSIVDVKNGLEYEVKTAIKTDVVFGSVLRFQNVRGGSLNNGSSWYSADSVISQKR